MKFNLKMTEYFQKSIKSNRTDGKWRGIKSATWCFRAMIDRMWDFFKFISFFTTSY